MLKIDSSEGHLRDGLENQQIERQTLNSVLEYQTLNSVLYYQYQESNSWNLHELSNDSAKKIEE